MNKSVGDGFAKDSDDKMKINDKISDDGSFNYTIQQADHFDGTTLPSTHHNLAVYAPQTARFLFAVLLSI